MFAMLGMLLDAAWKILVFMLVIATIVWVFKNGADTLRRCGNIAVDTMKLGIMKTEAKVRNKRMEKELEELAERMKKDSESSPGS